MHVLNAENSGHRVKCPECGKAVFWNPSYPFRPFCSERCKLIDLGAWASEEHAIAGEPACLDNLEEFPGREGAESD